MGLITFCSEGCCEGLAVLYDMQKVLIKGRESRGAWARRLVPKRTVRTERRRGQSRTAAVVGVSGVGASHTTPMSQAVRRLALLPLQPAPFTQTFLHVVLRSMGSTRSRGDIAARQRFLCERDF